ncbi:hypothetical protein B0H19DRAFT_1262380 [Mycena capillaripes]|nr:hypothetical protein B0H19DRAFT_1262380 [Mycena capillaripes]
MLPDGRNLSQLGVHGYSNLTIVYGPAIFHCCCPLVYGLAILDILQTALVTADAFHWFVFGFGNMDRLDDTFLNSWDVPMLDALISLIVQVFYCWRIYVLRKTLVFPALISVVGNPSLYSLPLQPPSGFRHPVHFRDCDGCEGKRNCPSHKSPSSSSVNQANQLGKLSLIGSTKAKVAFQTTWLVGSAVADVAIAVVLSWTLLRARSKAFATSHSLINRIVQLTVETNALTASVAVIAVVVYLAVPAHTTLVVPPTAIIGKLYTNCLIAVLNNRPILAGLSTGASCGTAINSGSCSMPSFQANPARIHVVQHIEQTDSMMEMSAFGKKTHGSEQI